MGDTKGTSKKSGWSGNFLAFGTHAVECTAKPAAKKFLALYSYQKRSQPFEEAIELSGVVPEICDARKFKAPLDQGLYTRVQPSKPLDWGGLEDHAMSADLKPTGLYF